MEKKLKITCEANGYIYGIHDDGPYRVKGNGKPESKFAESMRGCFKHSPPQGVAHDPANLTVWWFHKNLAFPYSYALNDWNGPYITPGTIESAELRDHVLVVTWVDRGEIPLSVRG